MRSGRPNMLKAYTQKGFTKNPIGKCDPVLYRLWHPKLASNSPKFRLFLIFRQNPYFLQDAPRPLRVSAVVMLSAKRVFGRIYKKCPPDTIVFGAKDNGICGSPVPPRCHCLWRQRQWYLGGPSAPLVAPGQPGQSKSLLS